VIAHLELLRGTPAQVNDAPLRMAAQDATGTTIAQWVDPGQAGIVDRDAFAKLCMGRQFATERAAQDKIAYANPWSAQAEHGRVIIVRGQWNDSFLSECENFPDGGHDDQIDAVSLAYRLLVSRSAQGCAAVHVGAGYG
jgi:predicted phage terminase large subunit-like protein